MTRLHKGSSAVGENHWGLVLAVGPRKLPFQPVLQLTLPLTPEASRQFDDMKFLDRNRVSRIVTDRLQRSFKLINEPIAATGTWHRLTQARQPGVELLVNSLQAWHRAPVLVSHFWESASEFTNDDGIRSIESSTRRMLPSTIQLSDISLLVEDIYTETHFSNKPMTQQPDALAFDDLIQRCVESEIAYREELVSQTNNGGSGNEVADVELEAAVELDMAVACRAFLELGGKRREGLEIFYDRLRSVGVQPGTAASLVVKVETYRQIAGVMVDWPLLGSQDAKWPALVSSRNAIQDEIASLRLPRNIVRDINQQTFGLTPKLASIEFGGM